MAGLRRLRSPTYVGVNLFPSAGKEFLSQRKALVSILI
jgi:hypothetical protein